MKKSYFPAGGLWLKGNLHSHTTVSDGRFSPSELVRLYADKGYDFLSMTDHNVFVFHNNPTEDDILLLAGVEHDIAYSEDKCVHIVGTGAVGRAYTSYPCRCYSKDELTTQQLLNFMYSDGQFVTIAHPVWSRMEPDELLELEHFHAVEVYNNGTEHLCHGGNAELYWDLLLRHGKYVLATASDDVHGLDDLFGGWICAKASECTPKAIWDSLFSGAFYASSGPSIYDFGQLEGRVYVSCSPCREIHFVTYPPRGKSFFAETSAGLNECSHCLTGRESYVRVVCVDFEGRSAWSQAIFLDRRPLPPGRRMLP